MTNELKILDMSRKREFFRKGKSDKWKSLNAKFEEKESDLKINYYSNIVQDLKESDSGQYSKIKRKGKDQKDRIVVEEDIPMVLIDEYSDMLCTPLAHIIISHRKILKSGTLDPQLACKTIKLENIVHYPHFKKDLGL